MNGFPRHVSGKAGICIPWPFGKCLPSLQIRPAWMLFCVFAHRAGGRGEAEPQADATLACVYDAEPAPRAVRTA